VLKALASGLSPCVFVTWDNKMPKVHAADLRHHRSTLAVINRSGFRVWTGTEESYVRDVVHRWLHRIELQEDPVVLYSTANSRLP
jgi:GTP:adenosylcobinamide-phosphate guanylyltransferase